MEFHPQKWAFFTFSNSSWVEPLPTISRRSPRSPRTTQGFGGETGPELSRTSNRGCCENALASVSKTCDIYLKK